MLQLGDRFRRAAMLVSVTAACALALVVWHALAGCSSSIEMAATMSKWLGHGCYVPL